MRSYTISSSPYASAANSFNSRRKVGFCVSFFYMLYWIRPRLPRCYGWWTLSKTQLCSFCFFSISPRASGQPFPSVLFYSCFLPASFFLQMYWWGCFGPCHIAQHFCSHPQAKEPYPFCRPSSGTGIYSISDVAIAIAVSVISTGSVVLNIFVVWTLKHFLQQIFAFVTRWLSLAS